MSIQTDPHPAGPSSSESLLIAAGRDRRPGSPLNIPPATASNFVLGTDRAYARDDGTRTWEALEEIVGLLEQGWSQRLSAEPAFPVRTICRPRCSG
jgi:cystathionine gamma-synthase